MAETNKENQDEGSRAFVQLLEMYWYSLRECIVSSADFVKEKPGSAMTLLGTGLVLKSCFSSSTEVTIDESAVAKALEHTVPVPCQVTEDFIKALNPPLQVGSDILVTSNEQGSCQFLSQQP